jgi:GT2 family glycosyltransferase
MNSLSTSVSIVIPNWNGLELLKKHLPIVIKNSDKADIIVVDDHSTDDSVIFLKKHFPAIQVIEKKKHEGFASTVNAGVEASKTDIVVLLNTDIEPEKDFLKPLIPHFSDPSVFAVGCMDKSYEKGNIVLRGRGIGWWDKGFYYHKRGEIDARDTAWVSGGSGAFRKSIWDNLGGMDTLFNPFYWEDIDLSYRARKSGYSLVFESQSVVHHFHEEGKIKQKFSSTEVMKTSYAHQFIFIWKNCTDVDIYISHILWFPIRIIQTLIHGNSDMFLGFLRALLVLPKILKQRARAINIFTMTDRELSMDSVKK